MAGELSQSVAIDGFRGTLETYHGCIGFLLVMRVDIIHIIRMYPFVLSMMALVNPGAGLLVQ